MLAQHRTFFIFCVVGLINTSLDVGLYLLLHGYGLPLFLANLLSTSAALAVSFMLNRRFTFNSSRSRSQAALPFLTVTLTGLWVLQPIIIFSVISVSNLSLFKDTLSLIVANYDMWQSLAGKLIATPATVMWNFILYKRFVFKRDSTETLPTRPIRLR